MRPILRRHALRTITLLSVAGNFGCSNTPAPASPAPGAPSATSSEGAAKAPAGPRIAGTVLLSSSGKPWAGGGVVYLEDAPRQPGAALSATVTVSHKEFTPAIAVITTGGTATFKNGDALTHHVFSPDIPGWDTGYLEKNATAVKTFSSPGPVALLCNIHPEMLGYLLVIPSTYFGKVGADGTYVIGNVPQGTYKATAWAPRLPTATQSVTVGSSGVATANFELRPAGGTN